MSRHEERLHRLIYHLFKETPDQSNDIKLDIN